MKTPKKLTATTLITVGLGVVLFFGLKVNSAPDVASSPYTIQEVEEAFQTTTHLELTEYLGTTPDGETLIAYRWKNYGLLDVFTTRREDKKMRDELELRVIGER